MINLATISLRIITISLLMTNLITIPMELSLLQKQQQKPLEHVPCSIQICTNIYGNSVEYLRQKDHAEIYKYHNIKSTIKDPMLLVYLKFLTKNKLNKFGGTTFLPARLFHNLNDNCQLKIYFNNGADFTFEDEPLFVTALCRKSKKFHGNSFAEEFNHVMNKFYAKPSTNPNTFKYQEEFINAGVLKKQEKKYHKGNITTAVSAFSHGPNGISSEQALLELIKNNNKS